MANVPNGHLKRCFAVDCTVLSLRRQGDREDRRARRVAKHSYPKFEVGLLENARGGIMLLSAILGLVTNITGSVGSLLTSVGGAVGTTLSGVASSIGGAL